MCICTLQFSKIFQSLQRFVVSDLSNFYLDIAKDRYGNLNKSLPF